MLEGKVNGLPALLKNMKKEKRVDYDAQMLVKETVVTLVQDYDQESVTGVVSMAALREPDQGIPAAGAPRKVAATVKDAPVAKTAGKRPGPGKEAAVKAPAAPGKLSAQAVAGGSNNSPVPAKQPAPKVAAVAAKAPAKVAAKAAAKGPAAGVTKVTSQLVQQPAGAAKSGKGNFGELLAGAASKSAFKSAPSKESAPAKQVPIAKQAPTVKQLAAKQPAAKQPAVKQVDGEAERKKKDAEDKAKREEEERKKREQEERKKREEAERKKQEEEERRRREEQQAAVSAAAAAEEEEQYYPAEAEEEQAHHEQEEGGWGEEEQGGWEEEEQGGWEEEEQGGQAEEGAEEEEEEGAWETCTAIGQWRGENPGDLPLDQGETIYILDRTSDPEGWWQGQKQDGATGYFPSTWVSMN